MNSMIKNGWIYCPICRQRTKTHILPDTIARNLPVWCPVCKNEFVIDVDGGKDNVIDIDGNEYTFDEIMEVFEKTKADDLKHFCTSILFQIYQRGNKIVVYKRFPEMREKNGKVYYVEYGTEYVLE